MVVNYYEPVNATPYCTHPVMRTLKAYTFIT